MAEVRGNTLLVIEITKVKLSAPRAYDVSQWRRGSFASRNFFPSDEPWTRSIAKIHHFYTALTEKSRSRLGREGGGEICHVFRYAWEGCYAWQPLIQSRDKIRKSSNAQVSTRFTFISNDNEYGSCPWCNMLVQYDHAQNYRLPSSRAAAFNKRDRQRWRGYLS